ncbi:MAG TPA: superoxide dismutase, Ni [Thermoplasmata archaeon]|nr:superoxide dismutase, Ni [Thermoplasmata archaeon]
MSVRTPVSAAPAARSHRARGPIPVYAHCDIPCGIYDPHEAQIAALTVQRMIQLIGELPKPAVGAKPEDVQGADAKLARYMQVKEQHAERVKSELRVIWGDYFTADHAKQFPELHDTFWNAMKLASKARQSVNPADAEALVAHVQKVAELFWKSKNVKSARLPSHQKVGGEIVYPAAA